MKAAALVGPGRIELIERPNPGPLGNGQVLLEVKMVGICGSDIHYFETGRIGDAKVSYPFVLGHEFAAVVKEVGPGVDRPRPGDTVAVDPAISCRECDQCNAGRFHTCRRLRFLGCPGQAEGCLCQYVVMPSHCCFVVPDGLDIRDAVLTEPLSIAVYAIDRAGLKPGMDVATLGAGPIGLCCLQVARAIGAGRCLVTDLLDCRIEAAGAHGADWAGRPEGLSQAVSRLAPAGLDVVLEAAGQQAAIDQAIGILRPGGVLAVIGIPRTDRIYINIHTARRNEVDIVNIRRQNNCTQRAIDLIGDGKVEVGFMATHTFTLSQCQQAFELVAGYKDGVIKAMVRL